MAMTWTSLTGAKTVTGSIKSWVNHSSIPVEEIVPEAEALIFQRLRSIKMQKLSSGTLASGDSSIDISALRFLSPRMLKFYGTHSYAPTFYQLELFEEQRLYDATTAPPTLLEGSPTSFTHDRSTIYFNVKANETHYYRLWYYERPEPLSDSNDTNLLTDDYPHILRQACMSLAFEYRKDEGRSDKALQKMAAYIDQAMVESDMAFEGSEYQLYWEPTYG